EQLQRYHEHSGSLLLASVISGLGLLLTAVPLYFLFRSARARSDRVRGFAGPLIILGSILVCAQGVVLSLGLKDASDQYVAGRAAVEAKALRAPAPSATGTTTKGSTGTGSTNAGTTTAVRTPAQRASDAKIALAKDKTNDSSKVRAGRIIF